MHRIAWATAACLLDCHGANAVDIVESRLNKLHEDRERSGSSSELEYWCEIGRAMIEILRSAREAGEAAH